MVPTSFWGKEAGHSDPGHEVTSGLERGLHEVEGTCLMTEPEGPCWHWERPVLVLSKHGNSDHMSSTE